MKVLVTGGAGFIGSTIASRLLDAGITPIILDSLITGRRSFTTDREFYKGDIDDELLLKRIFREHPNIHSAIHCAARIIVPESVSHPLLYFRENVAKTIRLLERLTTHGITRFIFSSSASVYQPGPDLAVDEDSPLAPTSPYAQSKAVVEGILQAAASAEILRAISLRYFNPIGADPSLRTGLQVPNPTHALGKMIQAWEQRIPFAITGTRWPTRDGTGLRDYIHVWDLAAAHVLAVQRFDEALVSSATPGYQVINLGTGTGTTVRELAEAFSTVTGSPLATRDAPSRPGDTAGAFSRSLRAQALLGWTPRLTVEEGVRHALNWREKDAHRAPLPT